MGRARSERVPALLRWWMWLDAKRYRVSSPAAQAEHADEPLVVLYDGKPDIRSLWKALLRHRTPRIEVVCRVGASAEGRLLAASRIAIPEREIFGRSLAICLQRRRALLERARRRLDDRSSSGSINVPIGTEDENPSAALIAGYVLRHIARKLWNRVLKPFVHQDHWAMAYRTAPAGAAGEEAALDPRNAFLDPGAWSTIPSPKGRFYADPFLWRGEAGERHLFFEDYCYQTSRARISHLTMEEVTRHVPSAPRVVIERPYHLSYPFLFRHDGHVYMIPEMAEHRTLEVYKADPFPTRWVPHKVLMRDVIAVDTTLHRDGDTWWMFTTIGEPGGSYWDELSLFYADDPFGTWHPHPMNPVVSDCRSARMAGNVFRDGSGRLIRPAQDCDKSYGAALVFCEIVECTKTSYVERILSRQEPPPGCQGVHTWNTEDDLAVTDFKMSRRK